MNTIKINKKPYRLLEWVASGMIVDAGDNKINPRGKVKIASRESKCDANDDLYFKEVIYRMHDGCFCSVGYGNKASHYSSLDKSSNAIAGRAVILLSDFDDLLEFVEFAECDIKWTASACSWQRFAWERRLAAVA